MTDSPKPLPYDMGNIGDLLKHGVMAEFIHWWCINHGKTEFVFLDPFCGHSWKDHANLNVIKRLEQLRDNGGKFEILNAQPDFDKRIYYGSTYVAIHQICSCKLSPRIYISDESNERLNMLIESRSNQYIKKIKCVRFYSSNGYSILDSINEKQLVSDMVLIDPFEDMEKIRQHTYSISRASEKTTVVLFVLVNDQVQWKKILAELPERRIILTCPRLKNIGINGESNYTVKVILTSHLLDHPEASKLRKKLEDYATALTNIVGKTITCV